MRVLPIVVSRNFCAFNCGFAIANAAQQSSGPAHLWLHGEISESGDHGEDVVHTEPGPRFETKERRGEWIDTHPALVRALPPKNKGSKS